MALTTFPTPNRAKSAKRAVWTIGTPQNYPLVHRLRPDCVVTGSTSIGDYAALRALLPGVKIVHTMEIATGLRPDRYDPAKQSTSLYHAITGWAMDHNMLTEYDHFGKLAWRLNDTALLDEGLRFIGGLLGSGFGEAGVCDAVHFDGAAWGHLRGPLGGPEGPELYPWMAARVDVLLGAWQRAGAFAALTCNSWGADDEPGWKSSDQSRWAGFSGESHWLLRQSRRGTGLSRLESFHEGFREFVLNPPAKCFGLLWRTTGYSHWPRQTFTQYAVASAICARAYQIAGELFDVPVYWEGDNFLDNGALTDVHELGRVNQIFATEWDRALISHAAPKLGRDYGNDVAEERSVRVADTGALIPAQYFRPIDLLIAGHEL